MDQTIQSMMQNAASTQAALAAVTWALGIAFSICFAVVVAGVKALYTLKSDVSVLLKSQGFQREDHDLQRKDIKQLSEKLNRLERDFSEFRGGYFGGRSMSNGTG